MLVWHMMLLHQDSHKLPIKITISYHFFNRAMKLFFFLVLLCRLIHVLNAKTTVSDNPYLMMYLEVSIVSINWIIFFLNFLIKRDQFSVAEVRTAIDCSWRNSHCVRRVTISMMEYLITNINLKVAIFDQMLRLVLPLWRQGRMSWGL